MPLYIGEYLKDTAHLRALESGAYLHLIMHYWAKGCLPTDDKSLAAIARMSDREWKTARPTIEAFFRPGWRHKRVEQELEKAQALSERQRKIAKARWDKSTNVVPFGEKTDR